MGASLLIAPRIVIMYTCTQKYMVEGLTTGSEGVNWRRADTEVCPYTTGE
jgi:hypothetical protein